MRGKGGHISKGTGIFISNFSVDEVEINSLGIGITEFSIYKCITNFFNIHNYNISQEKRYVNKIAYSNPIILKFFS